MSDLFHEAVPDEYIKKVYEVMLRASRHTFQILTKRAERLAHLAPRLLWPNMFGRVYRSKTRPMLIGLIIYGRSRPPCSFLSIEPLLGAIKKLPLEGISWVIVGGESGPRHRPIRAEWVREIKEKCMAANVPFFFKQWGGLTPKSGGRLLDGEVWDEMPLAEPAPQPMLI